MVKVTDGWKIEIGDSHSFVIERVNPGERPLNGVFQTKLAAAEHIEASLRVTKWEVARQIARAGAIRRREQKKVRALDPNTIAKDAGHE